MSASIALLCQRPFRGRNSGLARIDDDRLPQRASRAFEACFTDVVTVLAMMQHEVQVHQRVACDRFPEDGNQLAIELANLFGGKIYSEHERHSSAQINGRCHQRLFHWQRNAAVANNPSLVTECFRQRFAETDARVFYRVVMIDVQIALRGHRQVDQRVLRQQREHVIEETNAGVDLRLAGAIEIEGQVDCRFGSLPMNGGGAWHERIRDLKNWDWKGRSRGSVLPAGLGRFAASFRRRGGWPREAAWQRLRLTGLRLINDDK